MRRLLEGVLADIALADGERPALRASCLIEEGHPDFEGHFDAHAVFAACSQFEMLEALARAGFDPGLTFVGAPRVKFLGIIDPGTPLEVELTEGAPGTAPDAAPGPRVGTPGTDFDFSISRNGKVVTRGKIRLVRVAYAGAARRDASARTASDLQ